MYCNKYNIITQTIYLYCPCYRAYSTLIEDTIQQYLFEPSSSSQSHSRPPTVTSTSSTSSGDDQQQVKQLQEQFADHAHMVKRDTNNEVSGKGEREGDNGETLMDVQVATIRFQDEEGGARARVYSRGDRDCITRTQNCSTAMPNSNNKIENYSSTDDDQNERNTDVQVVTMEFSSDHEKGGGGGKERRAAHQSKVSELTQMFERSKLLAGGREGGGGLRTTAKVDSHHPKDLSCGQKASPTSKQKDRSKTSPPPVASKPKKKTTTFQETAEEKEGVVTGGAGGSCGEVAEFDYISRSSGQLFHVSTISHHMVINFHKYIHNYYIHACKLILYTCTIVKNLFGN